MGCLECVSILAPSPSIYRPGSPRENTPSTPGMPLGSNRETTRGRWGTNHFKVGPISGWLLSCRISSSDCQVGPTVGMGVDAVFLASYLVVVGPWICVLAPDWSRVCLFGLMMCHGHMGSCVAACRHVAWCGSHRAHMISCAYLFHPN
jgi:hypothetical protein